MTMNCPFDIYEYFNSRDVAEHCHDMKHEFTAMEAAYVVWHSKHHTLADKHKAWQMIIDVMPDEIFSHTMGESLHDFLKEHVQAEKEKINDFCSSRKNCIYSAMEEIDDGLACLPFPPYDNLEDCLNNIADLLKNEEYDRIFIGRQSLNTYDVDDVVSFNKDLEICSYSTSGEFHNLDIDHFVFSKMHDYTDIPVNFKRGDIVAIKSNVVTGLSEPAVLDEIATKDCGICTKVLQLRNGIVERVVGPTYINLQHYNANILEDFILIKALSAYYKNEIGIADLLHIHEYSINNTDEYLEQKVSAILNKINLVKE